MRSACVYRLVKRKKSFKLQVNNLVEKNTEILEHKSSVPGDISMDTSLSVIQTDTIPMVTILGETKLCKCPCVFKWTHCVLIVLDTFVNTIVSKDVELFLVLHVQMYSRF